MPELKAHGGDRKSEEIKQVGEHQVEPAVSESSKNDNTYKTRRIKRDAPDVYEKMLAGVYASVEQAAIAAGIKKPSDRWNAPGPVEKLATLIRKRYSEQQIPQVLHWMTAKLMIEFSTSKLANDE